MLVGYFDESEAHVGHRLFAVGGYIALDDDWPVIERAWQDALRMAGITRFHMRDFAHFRGEFTGWSESQRRDLINAFAAIIRPDVLASVVGVIELEPYERFFRPALPPGHPYREPYLLCLQTCMERATTGSVPTYPRTNASSSSAKNAPRLRRRLSAMCRGDCARCTWRLIWRRALF